MSNVGGKVVVIGTVTGLLETIDGTTRHIEDQDSMHLTMVGDELKVVSPPTPPTAAWHHVGGRES